MILPYVYLLTHRTTGHFYFGYREKNKVASVDDLGKEYFTSSSYIKKIGFDNFDIQILAEFFNPVDAYDFEQELIKINKKDPLCLNRHYTNGNQFRYIRHPGIYKASAETRAKISAANKGKLVSESTRKKISDIHRGKIVSEETRQKISKAGIGRTVTEETKQKISIATKGRPRAKFSDEWIANISAAQKRRIHGPTSDETKEKLRQKALNMSPETKQKLKESAIKMWEKRKAAKLAAAVLPS